MESETKTKTTDITDGMRPVFSITEASYVEHLWFLSGDKMDWMALLYKDTLDGDWRVTYRFRYYHSPDPWDKKDKKSVYEVKVGPTDEDRRKLLDIGEKLAAGLQGQMEKAGFPAELKSIPVKGNGEEFTRVLTQQSFAHVKAVAKEGETVQ